MTKRIVVIANPRAGRGRAQHELDGLVRDLVKRGHQVESHATQAPGHASELARHAVADLVVAAGGDGTVHEVVNGLLSDERTTPVPELGIVALGSGCDYIKTFGLPAGVADAADRLSSDRPPVKVDAGIVECAGSTRLFANIAEVGLGAAVVDRAARLPRRLGNAVYFASFWLTLPRFAIPQAVVRAGDVTYEGPLTNLVVAIGKAFGGGMLVAPSADPSDGLFDVQIHRGTKLDYTVGIPKVFRGTHLPHPKIDEVRSDRVEVTCSPDVLVEADGEVVGRTPATFQIMPGALRLNV